MNKIFLKEIKQERKDERVKEVRNKKTERTESRRKEQIRDVNRQDGNDKYAPKPSCSNAVVYD